MTAAATDYRAYAVDEMHRLATKVYAPLEDLDLLSSEDGQRLVFHGMAADDLVRMAQYLGVIPEYPTDGLLPNDVDLNEFIAKIRSYA